MESRFCTRYLIKFSVSLVSIILPSRKFVPIYYLTNSVGVACGEAVARHTLGVANPIASCHLWNLLYFVPKICKSFSFASSCTSKHNIAKGFTKTVELFAVVLRRVLHISVSAGGGKGHEDRGSWTVMRCFEATGGGYRKKLANV